MDHHHEADDQRNNKDPSASIVITPPPSPPSDYHSNGIVTQDLFHTSLFSHDNSSGAEDVKKNGFLSTDYELSQSKKLEEAKKRKMEAILQAEIELGVPKKEIRQGTEHSNSGTADPPRKGWEQFWRRTKADMMNERLLPVKILFFFKAATLFVLYPFLTLHIKSLGLDAAEAGINSAFIPVVAIIGPPIAGVIADKIGNFRIFLSAMTLVTAGTGLLLLLVPKARETVKLPADITFAYGCETTSITGGHLQLHMVENTLCTLNFTDGEWTGPHPSDVQCGLVCPTGKTTVAVSSGFHHLPSFPLQTGQKYPLPGGKLTFEPFTDRKPDLICNLNDQNETCFFGFSEVFNASGNSSASLFAVKTALSALELVKLSGGQGYVRGTNVTQLTLNVLGPWEFGSYRFENAPQCIQPDQKGALSSGKGDSSCVAQCLVNLDRRYFCSNKEQKLVYDVALTFWMYTIFRVILGLGSATTWIMFEGAVLAILKECGGDYGLQRVSALIAAIFVSPISGALIYIFHDFRPAFYLYAILQALSAFLTLKIDLTFKKPAEKVLCHLKEVLSQLEILIFFFAMFLSGSVWGYLESFLFWFLKNLGGSEVLMGLTISVGGLAGLPLLIGSRVIIKKLGHVNVLCIALVFYCIRLMGYSLIQNPWACLPMEAMEAITNSLAIIAAATYAAALSTEQTIASIQGFMGALYFGIGRGAGSLIGGFLMQWYGDRATFQIFSAVALISGIIYFIVNQAYLKKHSKVKHGIDLNNLRGHRADEEGGAHQDPPVRPTGNDESVKSNEADAAQSPNINAFDLTKVNGGYVGPCDINVFTDIPLDEEDPETRQNDEEEFRKTRPASFPLKSKSSLRLDKRPAES